MEVPNKRVSDSLTEQVQILSPCDMNGYGRLFGGRLMQWIDIVAGVVARRHANRNVTTACVDSLTVLGAAHANDTLTLRGRVTHVGHSSMEVCAETYVESLSGERQLVNRAYLVMVALDESEKPVQVPGLIRETIQEEQDWLEGEARRRARNQAALSHTART